MIIFHWHLCLQQLSTSDYIDDFYRIRRNSDVRFERACCWHQKGPKQDVWCIKCTGALLIYADVVIIPANSSFSQFVRYFMASDNTKLTLRYAVCAEGFAL